MLVKVQLRAPGSLHHGRAGVMKKRKSDNVVARKAARPARVNPFEVRVNRKKHDILGQKSKSDRGLPGISRSKAVKKVILLEILSGNGA